MEALVITLLVGIIIGILIGASITKAPTIYH